MKHRLLSEQQLSTVQQAIRFVCAWFKIEPADVESHARPWRLVWPRWIAIRLASESSGLDKTQLGLILDRNPSGVLHALRGVQREVETNRMSARQMAEVLSAWEKERAAASEGSKIPCCAKRQVEQKASHD